MEDAERAAFRRRLGVTLGRVRRKLTPYKSQASIGEAIGVDTETIGRWERGIREPKVYELAELWRRYDIPAEWLLQPTDSLSELDERIAGLRRVRQTQAALEAARADEGEGQRPSGVAASAARRGRRST